MSTANSNGGEAFNVGPVIRNIRGAAGMSQADLAQRLGTSQAHLSKWETGARSPRVSELDEIAQMLNRRLVVSFEPIEPKKPKNVGLAAMNEVLGERRGRKGPTGPGES